MAGRALLRANERAPEVVSEPDIYKRAAAKLYGLGYKRSAIAQALCEELSEGSMARTHEQKLSAARSKLKRWEGQDSFRDLIYAEAIVKLDMETPDILRGITNKAKRGRVDAARLVLELTGRHAPKDTSGPTNITIQIGNLPRPQRGEIVDGEAEEIEDSAA